MISKIFKFISNVITFVGIAFGLVYAAYNFNAMLPTIIAIIILAVLFQVVAFFKKPPTDKK